MVVTRVSVLINGFPGAEFSIIERGLRQRCLLLLLLFNLVAKASMIFVHQFEDLGRSREMSLMELRIGFW